MAEEEITQLTYEQRHKDQIEGLKAMYDVFKHMTTLSTASILLLATLLDKIFKSPISPELIGISFVALMVSLGAGLLTMFGISRAISVSNRTTPGKRTTSIKTTLLIGVIGSMGGFGVGIASLVVFALKNFYR